jgi:hypothetical protein
MLKKKNLVVLAVVLAGCSGGSESTAELNPDTLNNESELGETNSELVSSAAKEWFPMSEGDQWVLTSKLSTITLQVDYATGAMRHVTGLNSDGIWLGYSSSAPNTLYSYNWDSSTWGPFVRFGYRYTPWEFRPTNSACEKFNAHRTATDIKVTTPAGDFVDARTVSFDMTPPPNVRCMAPAFQSITFAPGVGPVALVTGAGEAFVLKSARVGAKVFPVVENDLVLKVTSDKLSYVNKYNTIVCITTPCPGNDVTAKAIFTLTLTNKSPSTQTFQFRNGKQFDFHVIDSTGKVVQAWSNGMMFTQALSVFSVAPGQTKTFTGEVELKDMAGQQLKGTYKVKGFIPLEVADGSGPSATTTITVSLVAP